MRIGVNLDDVLPIFDSAFPHFQSPIWSDNRDQLFPTPVDDVERFRIPASDGCFFDDVLMHPQCPLLDPLLASIPEDLDQVDDLDVRVRLFRISIANLGDEVDDGRLLPNGQLTPFQNLVQD